ncbi:hypothetical protein ASG43_19215 [Aureimonas sp. Leaf454]|uniref:BTAD domain-containing putative transcriptional regulator n=1 Tax=Aureimonas sp. Leaf454 TaxID=1736381 RepID=UPI0007021631|nr:BTAD domain-containing putative transcriptional regulator [Aureimonas sp. Leaf454]KQT53114.1 hypothetical protein ASG43_19215 [Aureimonas sp. Leaf454]
MVDRPHTLILLGSPMLQCGEDDRAVAFPQKGFVLAALLRLAFDGRAPRAALADWIYGDTGETGALANFRQLLSRIQNRQAALGLDLFAVSRQDVRFARARTGAPAAGSCDVDRLLRAEVPRDAASLASLTSLYRGDLLDGIAGQGETLDAWIGVQRGRLRERFGELVLGGATALGGSVGQDALRRLIEVDPYREEAWRALITLRGRSQGLAAAEETFEHLRQRLDAELGTEPDAKTAELLYGLRRRAGPARSSRDAEASGDRRFVRLLDPPFQGLAARFEGRAAPPRSLGAGAQDTQTPKPDATRASTGSRGGSAPPDGDKSAPRGEGPNGAIAALATIAPKLCLLRPEVGAVDPMFAEFAEGLIEDVTLGLCRLRSIAVIAPHTARQIDRTSDAADRFAIRYLVESSLRSLAGRVRLSVRLLRVGDRVTLWAEEFDIAAGAPADHHRELSRSLVLALADRVEQAEFQRFETTREPSAYHQYLSGRRHLHRLDLPAVRRARHAFSRAADLAPDFVPALNGLARTLVLEWLLLARTEQDLLRQARRIAARAVDLDPFSGEALRELASASLFLGGLDEALAGLANAERLAPHHADILAEHADALTHSSELLPALRRIEKAIELNPLPPDDYLWKAGGTLFLLENYDEALAYLGRMKQGEPAYRLTAACLARAGRREEAAFYVEKALEDQPNFQISEWIATIPLRSPDHLAHYAEALNEAGFR